MVGNSRGAPDMLDWDRAAHSEDAKRISAEYFDALAHEYLASYSADSLHGHVLRARQQRLLELLQDVPPGRFLDLGCGPAVLASEVMALSHDYVGVDASPGMIRAARAGLPCASLGVAEAERLPFRDGEFDVVACIGVLDRLPDPERALAEMARVLRPGGILLASFPSWLSPYAVWRGMVFYPLVGLGRRTLLRLGRRLAPDRHYLRLRHRRWTPGQAEGALQALVGETIAAAYYSFVPLLSPLDETFPRLAVRLARRTEGMHRGRLRKLGAGFILKTRKLPLCCAS